MADETLFGYPIRVLLTVDGEEIDVGEALRYEYETDTPGNRTKIVQPWLDPRGVLEIVAVERKVRKRLAAS